VERTNKVSRVESRVRDNRPRHSTAWLLSLGGSFKRVCLFELHGRPAGEDESWGQLARLNWGSALRPRRRAIGLCRPSEFNPGSDHDRMGVDDHD
jgi:hypothetical protein